MDLSVNQMTGTIPECIGSSLTKLTQFWVASNSLKGTFPTSFFQKLTLLESVDMSDNHFHGTFPGDGDWIGNLTHLKDLSFSKNSFAGVLPSSLSFLTNLERISGYSNNFTGPLPELGNAPNLSFISFSYNQLTGTVPASFESLTALSKRFSVWRTKRESSAPHIIRTQPLPLVFYVSPFFSFFKIVWHISLEEILSLQANQLTGDVSFLCNMDEFKLAEFRMDCFGGAEITCPCCTHCCDDVDFCGEVYDQVDRVVLDVLIGINGSMVDGGGRLGDDGGMHG
jgi:Leucine-rich repeat (LRR) protein